MAQHQTYQTYINNSRNRFLQISDISILVWFSCFFKKGLEQLHFVKHLQAAVCKFGLLIPTAKIFFNDTIFPSYLFKKSM